MSDQKHTPEPWQQLLPWAIATTQEDAGFERIVVKTLHHPSFADGESHANAARIVACVNACAGIDTAVLQAMPKPFAELLSQDFQQVVAERDQLSFDLKSAKDTNYSLKGKLHSVMALTRETRKLQKQYFKTHDPLVLQQAKELEAQLDKMVAELEGGSHE